MRSLAAGLCFLLALTTSTMCRSIEVTFDLVALGDDTYRYEYTVSNNGLPESAAALRWFDLLFDPTRFDESSLVIVSSPSVGGEWSELILASAPGVPAAYDVSTSGAGIAPGSQLGGLAVQFRWIGAGTPGAQGFEVYDPLTFDLLESGITVAVPELGTRATFALGGVLIALTLGRRRVAVPTARTRAVAKQPPLH